MPDPTIDRLRRLIQEQSETVDDVRPEAKVMADLGLDSLDVIELAFDIEDEFDIEIPNDEHDDIQKDTTVADLVAYIDRKMGARAG